MPPVYCTARVIKSIAGDQSTTFVWFNNLYVAMGLFAIFLLYMVWQHINPDHGAGGDGLIGRLNLRLVALGTCDLAQPPPDFSLNATTSLAHERGDYARLVKSKPHGEGCHW